ncbi:uncharacterized protein il2 [Salminus brasiliensis]|uniref:uncharacterized protein il2 n=1 Tax=Salminus brasiliensis TaxID=930266 RepID=UPI003B838F6B
MNSTCKEEDSTFYSASNVQPENIGTALTCTMKELATVPKQCFDDNKKIRHCLKASGLIMNILDMSPKTKQEYSACEIHEEKPYKEFLSDLKKLIQQLFSSTG